MILLDTNVLSELMRPEPPATVVNWLDQQPEFTVWVSSITVAEVHLGIRLMPDGRKKRGLFALAEEMLEKDFYQRCLSFDSLAAKMYAQIVSERQRLGRPISVEDAQIASIALHGNLTLATRNTRDFESITGLRVINPWTA
ncbi:MAG: type II toxin-antitoxin system VapC family toxin [Desulfovibrionales bacterium]|nr:MAG: type II toxin-antitoxin system VapC family toxin [Desulfovibrionales bacterium]